MVIRWVSFVTLDGSLAPEYRRLSGHYIVVSDPDRIYMHVLVKCQTVGVLSTCSGRVREWGSVSNKHVRGPKTSWERRSLWKSGRRQ